MVQNDAARLVGHLRKDRRGLGEDVWHCERLCRHHDRVVLRAEDVSPLIDATNALAVDQR